MTYDYALYLFKKVSMAEQIGELRECNLEVSEVNEEAGEATLRDTLNGSDISLAVDLDSDSVAEVEDGFKIAKGKVLCGFSLECSHGEQHKVEKFAKKLIDKFGGHLHDPQQDSIIYPKVIKHKDEDSPKSIFQKIFDFGK